MAHLIKAFCSFVIIQSFILWSPAYAQQPGDLDLTFGANGIVTADAGNLGLDDGVGVIKQLNDGQLMIAGRGRTIGFPPYESYLMLVKFQQNGTLTSGFGQNGFVITDLGGDNEGLVSFYEKENGKIIAGGTSNQIGIFEHVLIQFTGEGSLDLTFGDNGIVYDSQTVFGSVLTSLTMNQQDEFLATGTANGDVMLAKYASDGFAADNFGISGRVIHNLGELETITDCIVQTDGKILLAGTQAESGNPEGVILLRLLPDGSLDLSFNLSGWANLSLSTNNNRPADITLLESGKILVIGFTTNQAETAFEIFALRLMPDGSYDSSFGTNGIARYDIGSGDDYASAVVLQPDGKAIIGGTANNGNDNNFCLIRINEDGSLDPTFGNNGIVITEISPDNDGIADMELQADGKLVVAGTARVGTNDDIAIARYHTGINTSVAEIGVESKLSVFPNPAVNQLTVTSEKTLNNVELLDALGRTVLTQTSNANRFQLDLSQIPSGIYLLRATDGERMFTQKVVKE